MLNDSKNWHTLPASSALDRLGASEKGLSVEEAKKRLLEFGPNKLPEAKSAGIIKTFLLQFKSPLIYVLMLSAVVVGLIGDTNDSLIIIFVLLVNAMIGVFQEGKAAETLKSLRNFTQGVAIVVRDGVEMEIKDEELVPGDIISLRAGDKVAADGRLVMSQSLKINESALTGESDLIEKNLGELPIQTEMPDRTNMVYKGSLAVSGQARVLVVATGVSTALGNIGLQLKKIKSEVPLKKKVENLSKKIGFFVLIAAILVAMIGLVRGVGVVEIFFTAVAIAVSLIPEGLPVVITLILAKGVYRMAKRNALVKNMQAVEALGQASVLAVDKTGTITKNELMIQKVFVDKKEFTAQGYGYEGRGDIVFEGKVVDPSNHPELLFAGKVATFCADARVEFLENKEVKVIGDPTEAALLVFGEKVGFNKEELEAEEPKVFEIPFSFEHKFHTTLHKTASDFFLTVVGAPESVLTRSVKIWDGSKMREITQNDKELINQKIESFSKTGLRLLCFAVSIIQTPSVDINNLSELCLGGIFGMDDVLREEVAEAVDLARQNGVKTVMITGDHINTAEAIAGKAGIWREGDGVMLGASLAGLSDVELDEAIKNVSVFARVLPEHKLKIVESFKRRGEVIGMTGDGVNDALSLSAADLGIAMGIGGTEVSKEAADIVLLDNNFRSIISAIEEGRSIYQTIKKVVLYLVSTGIGEFLTIIGALVVGLPLPVSPTQILWLNLVTDGFLVVALAFEPAESSTIKKTKGDILGKREIMRAIIMGMVMMAGSLVLFGYAYKVGYPAAWTISLTVLAVFQWFNVWNCKSDTQSSFYKPFSNPYLLLGLLGTVLLQIFAIYNPFMQNLLHTEPLSLSDWGLILAAASSIVVVEEIRKLFARRKKNTEVFA